MGTNRPENMSFEAEVRRVAEAVWGLSPGECQPTHYDADPVVHELDGLARLRDVTHLLMVTTSTRLNKVKDDCKKLNAAENIERRSVPTTCKWLITEKQLDAQHTDHARKNGVQALTLVDFQRRVFDSSRYLQLRNNAAFGSARDPRSNSITLSEDAYVELPMRVFYTSDPLGNMVGRSISMEQIAKRLIDGEMIILRAPFGSGKSLTNREIFRLIASKYKSNTSLSVPLALNLREHWGAEFSDEILERHARTLGYSPKEDLVVAWRSGMCCLLLDGFDELAAQVVGRQDNKAFMREARRKALTGVRDFTQKLPSGVGVLVCGRTHYFDNIAELVGSLGIAAKKYIIVDLGEFDDKNTAEYLRRNGIQRVLPDWLPRKPLFLGYLLKEGLLDRILSIDGARGFGFAWDAFLEQICTREASLEQSVMEEVTVRSVLERLAFGVRSSTTGTGPITGIDLAAAYTAETGQPAGEGVLAQLQRLPGLAQRDQEGESRTFVDDDLLSALQGGAFAKYLLSRFEALTAIPLTCLNERALDMASFMLAQQTASIETVLSILKSILNSGGDTRASAQHAADGVAVLIRTSLQQEQTSIDLNGIVIDGAVIGNIPLDEIELAHISFKNCQIQEVHLGDAINCKSVRISSSTIGKITGVGDRLALPEGLISSDSEIEEYDNFSTNSAVLRLDISPQLKALLTVLRKVHMQSGGGRKLGALTRGISFDVQKYVGPVLEILTSKEIVAVHNSIVHPIRRQRMRVSAILMAPTLSDDDVAVAVRALN